MLGLMNWMPMWQIASTPCACFLFCQRGLAGLVWGTSTGEPVNLEIAVRPRAVRLGWIQRMWSRAAEGTEDRSRWE